MAETSRSRVTITLGRSGQVVQREGAVLDREYSEPVPAVGSKRSVRDRLGGNADVQLDNKRLRGDNGRLSNFTDDFPLSKDDLRFKIMKRTQTNGHHHHHHQTTVDLRDMLSRRARSSTTTTNPITTPHNSHDPRHEPQSQSQSQSQGQRAPDTRRMPIPDPRNMRQHMSQPQDERQRVVPHPRDGSMPKINGGMTTGQQYTSMRNSEGGPSSSSSSTQRGFLGNSYSPWSLEHIRRKSPERVLPSSRGLSPPPRRIEEPQRRIISREYENPNPRIENPRTVAYRDTGEISRPMGMSMNSAPFMTKPPLSSGPTKSLAMPPGTTLQRTQYPVQEHVTVEGFLRSLGLEKYVISFKVEEVDMAALSQMGDHDLKELGIPMGPRKKILLALMARTRRQAR